MFAHFCRQNSNETSMQISNYCVKILKILMSKVKVDKGRTKKKVGKSESSSVQFCTFASLLLTLVLHWFVSGFFSCQSITRRVKLVLPSTTLLALLHTHCTGLRTNEKCCLSFFPFLASRTQVCLAFCKKFRRDLSFKTFDFSNPRHLTQLTFWHWLTQKWA